MERTPKDYAIEHGEYLATAAETFQNTMNETLRALDEGEEIDQDYVSEVWQRLRDAIYEFRKRANRAKNDPPSTTGVDYLKITREILGRSG